jgi:hypothetical protein
MMSTTKSAAYSVEPIKSMTSTHNSANALQDTILFKASALNVPLEKLTTASP